MASSLLVLDVADAVATIRFNRPSALNAMTPGMIADLAELLATIDQRDDIRCLVLRGEGRAFMAGGDLDYLRDAGAAAPDAADSTIRSLNRAANTLASLSKPTIASVHGAVAGAGVSLTLACDIAIAADDARFVFAYDAIAAAPDGGLSWTLPRAIGMRSALAFAMEGKPIDAQRALQLGMVTSVVPAGERDARTAELAADLAARDTATLVRMRKLFRDGCHRNFSEQLEAERLAFVGAAAQPAFKAAIDAFYEARRRKAEARR